MNFDDVQTWTIPAGEVGLAYTYVENEWKIVWSKKRKLWILEIDKYYNATDIPWDYNTVIQFSYDKTNWFEPSSDATGSPDPTIANYIEYRPHKKLYVRWVDQSGNKLTLNKDYIYGYIVPLTNYTKYTEAKNNYDSGQTTKLEINKEDLAVIRKSENLSGNADYNEIRTNPVIVDLLFFIGWAPSNIDLKEISWNLPTNKTIDPSGETFSINITDEDNTGWEISIQDAWAETTDSLSGIGSTSISISVAKNTSSERSTTISLISSGKTIEECIITQDVMIVMPSWNLESIITTSASENTITASVSDPSSVGYKITASCRESSSMWINSSCFDTEYTGDNTFDITIDKNNTNTRYGTLYLKSGDTILSRCSIEQQKANSNLTIDTNYRIYLGPNSGNSKTINVTSDLDWTIQNISYNKNTEQFSIDTNSNQIIITVLNNIPSTQINAQLLGTFEITDEIRVISIEVFQNVANASLKLLSESGSEISLIDPGNLFNIQITSNTDWTLTSDNLGTISIDNVPNLLIEPKFEYSGNGDFTISANVGYGGSAGDSTTFVLTYNNKKITKKIYLNS